MDQPASTNHTPDPPLFPDDLARSLALLAEAAQRVLNVLAEQIAPALERIAGALEAGSVAPAANSLTVAIDLIRASMAQGDWLKAESQAAALARDFPDAAQGAVLAQEVARGRESAILEFQSQLDAARSANDPDRVVAIRDTLVTLISSEAKASLDREILQWLMVLLQRRMRTGTVRGDVADLAAKMAERFAHTKEGAGLRAALPTLRRAAGQCARCGQPYRGIADACPRCTGIPDPEEDAEDFLKSPEAPT